MGFKIQTIKDIRFYLRGELKGTYQEPEIGSIINIIISNVLEISKMHQVYLADIENYRLETAKRIAANEQAIAEFNAGIEHEKKAVRAEHKKKIAELEQKNREMKKKLADYKAEGKEKWEIFKAEFSHDMDNLGKAFKNITVKNV